MINKDFQHQKETVLKLTNEKEINIIKYFDKYYVSFLQKSNKNGKVYSNYINLNILEWRAFLLTLPNIDVLLQCYDVPDTLIPEKDTRERNEKSECSLCKDKMTAVITHNGRMNDTTKLKMADYIDAQECNTTVYNQMGCMCTYCGRQMYDDCHCHRFDCKDCEPNNFCEKCNKLIVYTSKFSDL